MFDEAGAMVGGITFGEKYDYRGFEKNLTTGKPVKCSGVAGEGKDAEVPRERHRRLGRQRQATGAPGIRRSGGRWTCRRHYNLDRIHLFPWDEGGRAFQYTIEVSTDEKNWTKVVGREQERPSRRRPGPPAPVQPAQARYVRVNMLKNSIQNAVQLEEVRVYEAGK